MSKRRLVITAVLVEKRDVKEVMAAYAISKSWLYELVALYRAEGEAAFEARSKRPKTSPNATPPGTVDLVRRLRKELTEQGLDAGPETIVWHLSRHHGVTLSRTTVARLLSAAGLVVPQPHKRPRSSWVRFQADLPNETWQADFTHYRLADRTDVEILTWLDDCTRYALSTTAGSPAPSWSPPSATPWPHTGSRPPP